MTDAEFLAAVRTMREHQKQFFAAHYGSEEKRAALIQSKLWEKAVDREIERRLRIEKGETLAL